LWNTKFKAHSQSSPLLGLYQVSDHKTRSPEVQITSHYCKEQRLPEKRLADRSLGLQDWLLYRGMISFDTRSIPKSLFQTFSGQGNGN